MVYYKFLRVNYANYFQGGRIYAVIDFTKVFDLLIKFYKRDIDSLCAVAKEILWMGMVKRLWRMACPITL